MKLYCDFWELNRNKEDVYNDVSLETVLEKFSMLDGKKRTELLLQNCSSLTISGGNNDLFIVYFTEGDNMFLLKKSVDTKSIVKLVVGGQLADFDIKYCHDRTIVNYVLNDFYNHKNILSLYDWKKQ